MSHTAFLTIERGRSIEPVPCAGNPRRHGNAVDLAPSVQGFGSQTPVLACTNGEVVDDRLYLKESQKHPADRAKPARLALDHITFDDQLQSRTLQPEVVIDYVEALRRGEQFPPVRVVRDENDNYYLVDGHHRVAATRQLRGIEDIAVEIAYGTFEDALWLSWGANRSHGLRRTSMDKRRAIEAAIQHPRWSRESDRAIARHIGCDHKTVGSIRRECGEFPTSENAHGSHSPSGPSKTKILEACELLSKIQQTQDRQFTPADLAVVRAGYQPLHRLLFGFSTLRPGKERDRSEK
jgi:hypothetical protein